MADYSLIRPDRRVGDPSGTEISLLQQMQGPGANQMVGFLNAARLDRQAGDLDYNLAVAEQNDLRMGLQSEADQRAVTQADAQRTNALRTAAIYSPAGAANVSEAYNLLTPDGQRRATELAEANVELTEARAARANRVGSGSGGGAAGRPMTEAQRAADADRDRAYELALRRFEEGGGQRAATTRAARILATVEAGMRGQFGSPERLSQRRAQLMAEAEAAYDRLNPPRPARGGGGGEATAPSPSAGSAPAADSPVTAPAAAPAAAPAPALPPQQRAAAGIRAAGINHADIAPRGITIQGNNMTVQLRDGTSRTVPLQ